MSEELGASKFISSLAFTITPLAEIPAMIYLGSLSDKIGREKIIALCLATYPIRYLFTVLVGNSVFVVLVQLLHGLTFGGLYVVSVAYISETVSEDVKGFALSIYTTLQSLGGFIGNYAFGLLVDMYGFMEMYFVAAAVSLVSVLVFTTTSLWLRRKGIV